MSTSPTTVVAEMVADIEEFLDTDARTDVLTDLLLELAAFGETSAPPPSDALVRIFESGVMPFPRPMRPRPTGDVAGAGRAGRRGRGVAAGIAAAAVAALSVTGAAAAANELPPSLQRVVAELSEDLLPFSFPRPHGDPGQHGDPHLPGSDAGEADPVGRPGPDASPGRRSPAGPGGADRSAKDRVGSLDGGRGAPSAGARTTPQGGDDPGAEASTPADPSDQARPPRRARPTGRPAEPLRPQATGTARPAKPVTPLRPLRPTKPTKPTAPTRPAGPVGTQARRHAGSPAPSSTAPATPTYRSAGSDACGPGSGRPVRPDGRHDRRIRVRDRPAHGRADDPVGGSGRARPRCPLVHR